MFSHAAITGIFHQLIDLYTHFNLYKWHHAYNLIKCSTLYTHTVVGVTAFFSKSLQHFWCVWVIVRVDGLKTKMVSAII